MEIDNLSIDHVRRESLLTNLGLAVSQKFNRKTEFEKRSFIVPKANSPERSGGELGGDELIKEKLRLIGMFSKDEGELSDDLQQSYSMKKIIKRNNLYQELLDDRNARFWYIATPVLLRKT